MTSFIIIDSTNAIFTKKEIPPLVVDLHTIIPKTNGITIAHYKSLSISKIAQASSNISPYTHPIRTTTLDLAPFPSITLNFAPIISC